MFIPNHLHLIAGFSEKTVQRNQQFLIVGLVKKSHENQKLNPLHQGPVKSMSGKGIAAKKLI